MHSRTDYWAAVKNELLGRCNKRKDCLNCLNIFIPILGPVLRLIEELTEEEEVFGHQVQVQNKEFQRRQENLVRDLKKSKAMLVELEKEKSKIEDTMYERFIPILNSRN